MPLFRAVKLMLFGHYLHIKTQKSFIIHEKVINTILNGPDERF